MLRNLVVVYPMPDGTLVMGVGPALSYYEFKQPMNDRLTDEKWKQMLRTAKSPALPEWVRTFSPTGGGEAPGRSPTNLRDLMGD
jgi:hypothetical protein